MQALAFQVGEERVALDIRSVVEVVPRVRLRRPGGCPDWLAGLFVYRGRVVPVIDLFRLAGAGECPADLSSRIILTPVPGGDAGDYLGLLAAGVADLRELTPPSRPMGGGARPDQPDLGPVAADGEEVLRLLDLGRLLPEGHRRQLALAAGKGESG